MSVVKDTQAIFQKMFRSLLRGNMLFVWISFQVLLLKARSASPVMADNENDDVSEWSTSTIFGAVFSFAAALTAFRFLEI